MTDDARRAAIYARVSSDDDARAEGRNLDYQVALCRTHAKEHGLTVVGQYVEDAAGVSGGSLQRPQLERLLHDAAGGAFDTVLVTKADRFSRGGPEDHYWAKAELARHGVQTVFVEAGYDASGDFGSLHEFLDVFEAERERQRIRRRTQKGRRIKAQSGKLILMGRAWFGYSYRKEGRDEYLDVHPEEAELVRRIFDLYVHEHLSLYAIAQLLNEQGVVTPAQRQGRARRATDTGRWHPASVRRILSAEVYTGKLTYNATHEITGEPMPATADVPAIIPGDLFAAAQRRFEENKRSARRNRKYEYLLSGRVRCGACGYAMAGVSRHHGKRRNYECGATVKQPLYANLCTGARYYPVAAVDDTVWGWIRGLLTNPQALWEALQEQEAQRELQAQPLRERLARLDTELARHKEAVGRLVDLYADGGVDKETYTAKVADRERRTLGLKAQRAETARALAEIAGADAPDAEQLMGFARQVAKGLAVADADFDAKRRILRLLDVRCTLTTAEDGARYVDVRCAMGGTSAPIELQPSCCSC